MGTPVITLGFGEDQSLSSIDRWGYASSNANGVSEFSLRFATDADGPGGFGTSITFNPSYSGLPNDDTTRQSFIFGQSVAARYVELTTPTVSLSHQATSAAGRFPEETEWDWAKLPFPVPEPGSFLLCMLGMLGLTALARRR